MSVPRKSPLRPVAMIIVALLICGMAAVLFAGAWLASPAQRPVELPPDLMHVL